MDGRADDATSAFISPRPRQETLQFMVDAFKFAGDDRNLVRSGAYLPLLSWPALTWLCSAGPNSTHPGDVGLISLPDLHHVSPEGLPSRPGPQSTEQSLLLQQSQQPVSS